MIKMESTINTHQGSYTDTGGSKTTLTPSLTFLEKATWQLRVIGIIILFFTLTVLSVPLINIVRKYQINDLGFAFCVILTFINIFLTIFFDYLRKKGETIFEEVSDELHWYIGYEKGNSQNTSEKKPEIKIRILLREFVKTTDLPLIPGKYGPAVYIGINIIIISFIGYWFYTINHA